MTDYVLLDRQLRALLDVEKHPLPVLANVSAMLFETLEDLNWAGFYLMEGGELMLGPFQGRPACIRIPIGRGVCGAAVEEGRTQLVQDVRAFPGHIACDERSRSELVIPLRRGEEILGVLDMDSPLTGRFTVKDKEGLETVMNTLVRSVDWGRWKLQ